MTHPQADLIRQAAHAIAQHSAGSGTRVLCAECCGCAADDATGDGETGVLCAMRNAVANLLDAGWIVRPPLDPAAAELLHDADRLVTVGAITRDLAAAEPVACNDYDTCRWCTLCGALRSGPGPGAAELEEGATPTVLALEDHTETCPWRRAREAFPQP